MDALPLPEGELMLRAHVNDTKTPLDTIEALMEAMEAYCPP